MIKYRQAALVAIYERRLRMKLRRILRESRNSKEPSMTHEEFWARIAAERAVATRAAYVKTME